jgi:predicted ribosomally synthesized peptide with SipW-like signal peptide
MARNQDDPMSNDAPSILPDTLQRRDLISFGVVAAVLLLVLLLDLLPALLAALLVFELVNVLVPRIRLRALGREGPRVLAVTLIATAVIAALTAVGVGVAAYFSDAESIPALFRRMAQIIENSRDRLPAWLVSSLPADAEQMRLALVHWLRTNAGALQIAGQELGRALAHILIGMVIGALLSLQRSGPAPERPLSRLIFERAVRLSAAFRRVVFAQFWISAINTTLTAIYLLMVLPLFGVDLPLVKTLVAVTFVAGLLPILGNLISNTVIFIVSLSQSLWVALASLTYLIVIHKLEYFLNARIIGFNIGARAWELLIAMLAMEAAFGIPGLIAAPIFYAYLKNELREKALV